jgi:hypothetical protein
MLNPESYKDGAIEQIAKYCDSVTPEDAEIIGDIITNTLTQYKKDLVDQIGVDCLDGIKDRLEHTLSLVRSA